MEAPSTELGDAMESLDRSTTVVDRSLSKKSRLGGPDMRRISCAGLLASLMLLAAAASLAAAEYFITNKPGSGTGTAADPFGMADLPDPTSEKLKSKALEILQPGDTLTFRGGDYSIRTLEGPYYYLGYLRTARHGEPDRRITLRAMIGEKVRLIHAGGAQPMLGGGSYVTYEGFTIETGPAAAARIGGEGVEVAYCHIKGVHIDTADNHDGLRIEGASDCRIHHNIIEGVTGRSANSAGIKLYRTKKIVVEDNLIRGNTDGVFDKDSGIGNTYRRNWLTGNREDQFQGNNQGELGRYFIYENVIDGQVNLHYKTDGCEIHNNLVRADTLTGAWAGGALNNTIYNNVVLSKSATVLAFYDHQTSPENGGEKRNLAFMDFNLYTAPPRYSFGQYTKAPAKLTLEEMREKGYEKNSQVAGASEIFQDETTWRLKPRWTKAGRDGGPVGPDNVAEILDVTRYGPEARKAAAAKSVAPTPVP